MKNQKSIDEQIQSAEQELAVLDEKRKQLQARINQLKLQKQSIADEQLPFGRLSESSVTNESTQEIKITLFRSLFRGREDVYPRRFESKRTGKSGYQPVCRNEWIRPIGKKPKIKCGDCENRSIIYLSPYFNHARVCGVTRNNRRHPPLSIRANYDRTVYSAGKRVFLSGCSCHPVDTDFISLIHPATQLFCGHP